METTALNESWNEDRREIKELSDGINLHPAVRALEALLRNQGDEIYLQRKFSFADVVVAAIFR